MKVAEITSLELAKAKCAFTTRRVPAAHMKTLITGDVSPRIGDLVLATVDKIESHPKIELPSGRRAHLAVGDPIVAAELDISRPVPAKRRDEDRQLVNSLAHACPVRAAL